MIKVLLIIFLILPPANADDHITAELCEEIRHILVENVEKGYINEQEASDLLQGCEASL